MEVDGSRAWTGQKMKMAGRRKRESAARTRYVHGRRGEDRSLKSYLRKVMDKRRRWMELGTRTQ